MIRFQDVKPNGKVDVWDLEAVDGPLTVELFAVDARHAIEKFPDRWMLKLPKGSKPGPAQIEAEERAAAEAEGVQQADPHFGGKAA